MSAQSAFFSASAAFSAFCLARYAWYFFSVPRSMSPARVRRSQRGLGDQGELDRERTERLERARVGEGGDAQ